MWNQSKMPLVERLDAHAKSCPVSLHVPGHKGGAIYPDVWQKLLKWDVTEITGMDDLHHAEDVILEAEMLLADCYGVKKSYFLVNGTSAGNLAVIMTTLRRGEKVLVPRDAHKSILHGIELAGGEPIFLSPQIHEEAGVANGVTPELIVETLHNHPDVKLCIFTYPSYYGTIFNLQKCIQIAQQFGAVVFVDEAHGAHFLTSSEFPKSAVDLGADIVVQSAHKTLPALTMGSYLHIVNDLPIFEKLDYYLQVFQTSSPSYLIMASLDAARKYVATYSEADVEAFWKMRARWIKWLTKNKFDVILPDDPLKIIVRKSGYTGYELQEIFEASSYFPELADEVQLLLILPLIKKGVDFTPISRIRSPEKKAANESPRKKTDFSATELALTYEEMHIRTTDFIRLDDSLGFISAETISLYPPGIPTIIRGERLTEKHVYELKKIQKHHYQGGEKLATNYIRVFR
ncbi:decarboxylase [Listeria ivanovii]|uniref:aminotransferase class I/II-fold pyridoxal phosphate-dependent enzyme n=1 Tax=Listeria ivanovii TaxID=1638 RepID=UPI000DA73BC2|nr:aminotransferase class I/II-fold pyridoxal phosphate-dependent enzyme [Listeria ivanovii]PZG33947.1 decarboxylase [Listeria ivanovii]PZG48558.1 decarboxylase [Listeria ivanovii]PZH11690.1 decarboxylase [Listeria ivanovii]